MLPRNVTDLTVNELNIYEELYFYSGIVLRGFQRG